MASAGIYMMFKDADSAIASIVLFIGMVILVLPGERALKGRVIAALALIFVGAISPVVIGSVFDWKRGQEWILFAPGFVLMAIGATLHSRIIFSRLLHKK